ncbi:histone-like nucleoid-structuring protein Lsr2 [Nocardia takedensis]|uniref:histone-like nucleoid-structuring protein Lsr2 n=1 Tax=Nocardia takedensis TaxID=259390 RepID=UPI003F75CF1C
MARIVIVELVDDLDGLSVAEQTVRFAVDGVVYEIDLSSVHAQDLRAAFACWIVHARRTAGRSPRRGTGPASVSVDAPVGETARVRAWARGQGIAVAGWGRVSQETARAYRATRQG